MKITVAGLGYVGLSIAVLLAQHNDVTAIDISKERVDLVNSGKSPIEDEEFKKYLAEGNLKLKAIRSHRYSYKLRFRCQFLRYECSRVGYRLGSQGKRGFDPRYQVYDPCRIYKVSQCQVQYRQDHLQP